MGWGRAERAVRSRAAAEHQNGVEPWTARPKGGIGGRGAAVYAAGMTDCRDTPKNQKKYINSYITETGIL